MLKLKNIFILVIIISAILWSNFALASVKLEQIYPENVSTKALAENPSIQDFIRYYADWAIIIAILVAIMALIAAGVMYLTASGKPLSLANAKTRVYKAFLGLGILIASYLVLSIINPEFSVLTIKYVPVQTGIVLFNEQGFDEFTKLDGIKKFQSILDQKNAYFLHHDIIDSTNEFGELIVTKWENNEPLNIYPPLGTKAERVSFIDFQPYAIGFWNRAEKNTILWAYPAPNFGGLPKKYSFRGKLDEQDKLEGSIARRPDITIHGMSIIKLGDESPGDDNSGFFRNKDENKDQVSYINIGTLKYLELKQIEKDNILKCFKTALFDWPKFISDTSCQTVSAKIKIIGKTGEHKAEEVFYPPLSFRVTRNGAGLYLYSSDNEERFLNRDKSDFSDPNFDFDNKAQKVKIKRKDPETGKTTDFLAAIYTNKIFSGAFQLLFIRREIKNEIPKFCADGKLFIDNNCGFDENKAKGYGDGSKISRDDYKKYLTDGDDGKGFQLYDSRVFGYLQDDIKTDISVDSYQGTLPASLDISSARLFEIAGDNRVCREVRICTEVGSDKQGRRNGNCIAYINPNLKQRFEPEIGVAKLPMPFYAPINIPEKARIVKEFDNPADKVIMKEASFRKKIKSISIDGSCVVALFENTIKFKRNNNSLPLEFDKWDKNTPGVHSQIFDSTNFDLLKEEIGQCGSISDPRHWRHGPCASAIVVFPYGETGAGSLANNQPNNTGGIGACDKTKNNCDDKNAEICGEDNSPGNCNKTEIDKYDDEIDGAITDAGTICGDIDTKSLIKAIMSQESGGDITSVSNSVPPAYGLMQLKVATAQDYVEECATGETITSGWFTKSENGKYQNIQKQICIAIKYLQSLVGTCGCDVRHLAAGYNGGANACLESEDCGLLAKDKGGQCLMCAGESYTRKWECLWDEKDHSECNATDELGKSTFEHTRYYVPKVNYCYNEFKK